MTNLVPESFEEFLILSHTSHVAQIHMSCDKSAGDGVSSEKYCTTEKDNGNTAL